MPLSENFIRDEWTDPDTIFITGTAVNLTPDLVSPKRHIVVRADEITVAQSFEIVGKNIHLFARNINFGEDVILSTPGLPADPDYTGKTADNGSNPGANGTSGKPGGDGQKAGQIKMMAQSINGKTVLKAQGSKGGKGESGGSGAVGKPGPDGAHRQRHRDQANGSQGRRGGAAGHAGIPGKGGDGGLIVVTAINDLDPNNIKMDISAGSPGDKATRGNPGNGGPGGKPGSYISGSRRIGTRDDGYYVDTYSDGEPGGRGPDGKKAPEPQSNEAGEEGEIRFQNPSDRNDPDYFGEQLTPLLGNMILRDATLDHVNDDREIAAKKLAWLHTLLQPETQRMGNSTPIVDADAPGKIETVPDESFDPLRIQVATQIHRLRMGLDAYGNAPSFVPILDYKFYDDYIQRWLDSAEDLEDEAEEFNSKFQQHKLEKANAKKAIKRIDGTIINLRSDITAANLQIEVLRAETLTMVSDIQDAAIRLVDASTTFQNAVRAKANGCEFSDVLQACGALLAIKSGGATAIGGIGPTIDAINSDEKDIYKYFDLIGKKSKVIVGGFNEFASGYNQIKDVLTNGPAPYVPNDAAKIIAEHEDIMAIISDFRGMPEAEGFKEAIDAYVNLVLARNSKILEHDSLEIRVREAESQIKTLKRDKEDIGDKIATGTDPNLPELKDLVDRNLDVHKSELVRSIYLASKALEYMTMAPTRPDFDRQRISSLRGEALQLTRSLKNAYEATGRPHIRLNVDDPVGRFSLKELVGEEGIQALRDKKKITFVLPDNAFPDRHHILTTQAKVIFQGVAVTAGRTGPTLRLVHLGDARMRDRKNQIRSFTHVARKTFIDAKNDQGASLGGNDKYIPLTPLGTWQADIDLGDNNGIDFDSLDDVQIGFAIDYLPN